MMSVENMNQRLAEAVIGAFRESGGNVQKAELARFGVRDWRRSLHWLDASGLALYFLNRVRCLSWEDIIPSEILRRLEARLEDNKHRTADQLNEFLQINQAFQNAGLRYVNLKGFTLIPDYCPDPSLRCQFDLDFLVPSADVPRGRDILEILGYVVTGRTEHVVELKAGSGGIPSIHDLYKPGLQRLVEVHFLPPIAGDDGPLARVHNRIWSGAVFPALSDTDMFLAQALHLFRHLKSEWTRIAWLLEFRTFVAARRDDTRFWQDVHKQAATSDEGALAVGISVWLATKAFGEFAPSGLLGWSRHAIPGPVRLWLERYGKTVLVTDFPGTKLYLLLDQELSAGENARKISWGKVLPLHRPPRISNPSGRGPGLRIRASLTQVRFMLFRLRFHILEGSRYVIAAHRWRRMASGSSG